MKKTLEQIIDDFKNKHGDKFDYSRVVYVNIDTPVEIICPKHGLFQSTPYGHIKSKHGCLKCGIKNYVTLDELKVKCFEVHGYKFLYDFKNLERDRTIKVTCEKHNNSFNIKWFNHIKQGHGGCNFCLNDFRNSLYRSDISSVLQRMSEIHKGIYDYSKVGEIVNLHHKISIICKKHGVFEQSANSHLQGHGCKLCAHEIISDINRMTTSEYVVLAKSVHGDEYDYSTLNYTGNKNPVKIVCKIHGEFIQYPSNHLKGHGCKSCANMELSSKAEKHLIEFIVSKGIEVIPNHRPTWLKGKELDLYIPSLNLAIEYNGIAYHHTNDDDDSDFLKCTKKSSSYHHNKFIVCKKNNVNLIHIFEFESIDSWKCILDAYLDNTKDYTIKFNNLRRTITYKNKEYKVFGKSYVTIKKL